MKIIEHAKNPVKTKKKIWLIQIIMGITPFWIALLIFDNYQKVLTYMERSDVMIQIYAYLFITILAIWFEYVLLSSLESELNPKPINKSNS